MPPFVTAWAVQNQISGELLKTDHGIIHNAMYHLTWAFIGVFKSFLGERVKENAIY